MRDSYVADVGDFGKYALAGSDLRLGVLWCRNSLAGAMGRKPKGANCGQQNCDFWLSALPSQKSRPEQMSVLPTQMLSGHPSGCPILLIVTFLPATRNLEIALATFLVVASTRTLWLR
jgi:hypothetical protein